MTLFVSDLHLGRGTPAETRAAERDAVAMLRAHEADLLASTGTLVLLGDVFDQFIEYRHLIPKHAPRLIGLLADWADRGARIVYAVGNRDPWHETFFEHEVGAAVLRQPTLVRADGRGVYLDHGDRHGRPTPAFLHSLLRAPLMARLYRMGLPGDAGFALARWTARRFGSDGAPTPAEARTLRRAAFETLERPDVDVVACGHAHAPAIAHAPGGTYLNPGYWFGDRTFARLGADGAALFRWTDGHAEPLPLEAGRLEAPGALS